MKYHTNILLSAGLLTFGLTSCGEDASDTSGSEATATQEDSAIVEKLTAEQKAKEAEVAKKNAEIAKQNAEIAKQNAEVEKKNALVHHSNDAVTLLGHLDNRAEDSHARYTNWVSDLKKGPSGKERYISHGLYALDYDDFKRGYFEKVTSKDAYPQLRDKAKALEEVYAKLAEQTQKADRYFEHEDYKDDAGKKGREIHVVMMPLFEGYFAAKKEFVEDLKAITQAENLAQIEKAKKEGRVIAADLRYTLIVLEKSMNYFSENEIKDYKSAEIKEQLEAVKAQYAILEAHSMKDEEVKKEMANYLNSLDNFVSYFKKLSREVDAKGAKIDISFVNNLFIKYKHTVGTYNNSVANDAVLMSR